MEVGFDQSYSFIYSKRPGTPAAGFADDVPMAVKKQRLHILQTRINQQAIQIGVNIIHPSAAELTLEPPDNERLANLCGPLDQHLRQIERRLGVEINNRGNI